MSGGVYVGGNLSYLSNSELIERMNIPSLNPTSRTEFVLELSSRTNWEKERVLPRFTCTKSMKKTRCDYFRANKCVFSKECEFKKEV